MYVEYNARHVSYSRNGLGLIRSTSNKIIKQDLKWYPYQLVTGHEFRSTDYIKASSSVNGFRISVETGGSGSQDHCR